MTGTPEAPLPTEVAWRAAILAGGRSSRMGREKALIPINGVPLIARTAAVLRYLFRDIVVVTTNPEVAEAAGCSAVLDVYPGFGPLGGIHAALRGDRAPCLVVACDLPFLNPPFLDFLCTQWNGHDAVVPRSAHGLEPLQAIYGGACAEIFERHLTQAASGTRLPSLRDILAETRLLEVSEEQARGFDPELRMFENWNTPGDVRDTL